jgi:DNA polymerase-1
LRPSTPKWPIPIDLEERERQTKIAENQLSIWEQQADDIVGREINLRSPKQLKEYLYDECKMDVQYKRDAKGKIAQTTDENALKRLSLQYPENRFLRLLSKYRKLHKLTSTYLKAKIGPDERIRCSYGWNKTGRNNTSKNPFKTGMNLQNQPRNPIILETGEEINIKKLFIADPGCLLLEADYEKAESWVTAFDAEDENYMGLLLNRRNIHCINASALVGKTVTKGDKIEYHLGKIASHAAPYGIEAEGINEEIIKNLGVEYALPIEQLKAFLKDYFRRFPGVKRRQSKIRNRVQAGLPICNPFGRCRKFLGPQNKKTYREGYAQTPQSTVPDMINRAIQSWESKNSKHYPVLLQVHDSALMQIPEGCNLDQLYGKLKEHFEMPISIYGREFTIPIEVKIGKRWGDMEEYK